MRNIYKEKQIESQVAERPREKFFFRYFPFEGQDKRIGKEGIESRLIATVADCTLCKPSNDWLGKFSPLPQIKNGKLWMLQHLKSGVLINQDKDVIVNIIRKME
jgi:hypothetical protein